MSEQLTAVILQPSYIPWRGYFHQIQKSDVFVFYDCVQYDDGGWRNRNRIKTPSGAQWLTIPVKSKGAVKNGTPICDIPIAWERRWNEKHLTALQLNYGKAPFFDAFKPLLEEAFSRTDERLADFTCWFTEEIARRLGISDTTFMRSSVLQINGSKSERLLSILKKLGATRYISGPAAESYLDAERFEEAGISVEFMNYDYPTYPQRHGEFDPNLSILDLVFNVGTDAASYIWEYKS